MKTNLIQSFINTQNFLPYHKKDREFDLDHELKNKTFMRPLKGNGYLIKSNIFDAPAIMVKSAVYDINALNHSVKGKANDHELGKMNDLGMKVGGLAIAGYLFTRRQTPMTKAMEFVGLGSFFASMALWPKIALQIPARLIHGFNVQQQYVDSMGRKKPFFQDPQFLPWDLYSDDEINKIGDRMGVPRNIENRRDFIQEKMKKIAIQNNTLWMLTAGFATPVMSALICNQLEKPLGSLLSANRNNANNHILNHFTKSVNNTNDIIKNVNNLLSINQNQPLTEKLLKQLSAEMTKGFDSPYVTDAVTQDLKGLLDTKTFVIDDNSIKTIIKGSRDALKNLVDDPDAIDKLVMNSEDLTHYFDYEKGYFLNSQTPAQINKIFREYQNLMLKRLEDYNKTAAEPLSEETIMQIQDRLLFAPQKNNPIYKGLTQETYTVLDANNQKTIRFIAQALNDLRAELSAAEKYLMNQLGQAPETTIADYWNNTVKTFIECLNLSHKQMEAVRGDRLAVAELLRDSYDRIASDKKLYNQVVSKLVKQISKINKLIKQTDVNDNILTNDSKATKFDARIDAIFNKFAKTLKDIPYFENGNMECIIREFIGSGNSALSPENHNGSYKDVYKVMLKERLLGVKSSFYRILNALDLHRRIAVGDKKYITSLHDLPREVKEEAVELSKGLGINAHTADFFTKFFSKRHPKPNVQDTDEIQLKNGKTVYKYFNKQKHTKRIDIPQDASFFKQVMSLQYKESLLDETEQILKPYKELYGEFLKYRELVFHQIGNIHYIEKILHKVDLANNKDAGCSLNSKTIFETIGAATDEIVHNYCKQTYNTDKWLKMFGTTGAVLLGLTVFAQFFFGRMKTPKPIPQTPETNKDN